MESILQFFYQKVAKYVMDEEQAMRQKDIPRISQNAYQAVMDMYIDLKQSEKAFNIYQKMQNNIHIVIEKNGLASPSPPTMFSHSPPPVIDQYIKYVEKQPIPESAFRSAMRLYAAKGEFEKVLETFASIRNPSLKAYRRYNPIGSCLNF